jgi:hypothetical protein
LNLNLNCVLSNSLSEYTFLKLIIVHVLVGFASINLQGQNLYNLVYDVNYSSVCGAENLLTLHKATTSFENSFLRTRFNDEKKISQKLRGIAFRVAKTVLIDDIINHLTILTQHEIFGHGGRYREFGYKNNSFHLDLVPPYGKGHGWAQWGQLKSPRLMSDREFILCSTGGNEANTVFSQHLINKWLLRGSIDYSECLLFLESSDNLIAYIYFTKYSKKPSFGNDIKTYIMWMNLAESKGEKYSVDQLAKQSLIGMINPFQLYAAFTYTVVYLVKGRDSAKLPMISIKNTQYLPAFHYGFSPFGSEYYFDNYFVNNKKAFTAYFRLGDTKYHTFWGFGINALNLINYKNLLISPDLNIWNQPAFEMGEKTLRTQKAGYGGAFSSTLNYYFSNKSKTGVSLRLGYKTAGFLAGENLSDGLIFSAGLSFKE